MKKNFFKVKIQLEMQLSFEFNELGELVSAGIINDNHAVKTSVVSFEHVMQNVAEKLSGESGRKEDNKDDKRFLRVRVKETYSYIDTRDIKWIEGDGYCCTIYMLDNKKIAVGKTLSDLLSSLPQDEFVRIHKSHVVNLRYVSKRAGNKLYLDDVVLNIGKSFKNKL